ncbi:MAG: DUF6144 family protein [Promethearchaeota archaeon]
MLERAGRFINSIIRGLEDFELEKRRKVIEKCGETCALDGSLNVAQKIAAETENLEEIIEKANTQIPWCGKWILKRNQITSKCMKCGCPLVINNIVKINSTFCYCSVGWVRIIFETLLKKPIEVKLEKSIGFGDNICEFIINF